MSICFRPWKVSTLRPKGYAYGITQKNVKAVIYGFGFCMSTKNNVISLKRPSVLVPIWEQEFCGYGTGGGVLLFILSRGSKDPSSNKGVLGPRFYDLNVFGT